MCSELERYVLNIYETCLHVQISAFMKIEDYSETISHHSLTTLVVTVTHEFFLDAVIKVLARKRVNYMILYPFCMIKWFKFTHRFFLKNYMAIVELYMWYFGSKICVEYPQYLNIVPQLTCYILSLIARMPVLISIQTSAKVDLSTPWHSLPQCAHPRNATWGD